MLPILFGVVIALAVGNYYRHRAESPSLERKLATVAQEVARMPHGDATHVVVHWSAGLPGAAGTYGVFGSFSSLTSATEAISMAEQGPLASYYYVFDLAAPDHPLFHLVR
jgi:hypothetical protein